MAAVIAASGVPQAPLVHLIEENSTSDGRLAALSKAKTESLTTSPDVSPASEGLRASGSFCQVIERGGKDVTVQWTKQEERRIVWKVDAVLLPLFVLMFSWMSVDRSNVSGVLTSTFLDDTHMTRDQANTGVSLLWLGIVLLELPSNIVLHRVGAHYWIPAQVVTWGLIEVLQMFVKGAGGWYAARLFLGLAESGFMPGSLYTISQWYTQDEIAKRTTVFFFGIGISAAFGSLISAGSLRLEGHGGLKGWQWIFLICGISTIASGIIAFALLPKSPHQTDRYFGGLIEGPALLSEREADIFVARLVRSDPLKGRPAALQITFKDVTDVLTTWLIWPYLIVSLSGLQSINALATWGATIVKSLGFTSIEANLLSAPAPVLSAIFGLIVAALVDRYKRFGYAIILSATWTLAGLIAVYHLPLSSEVSWSFYGALVVTCSAPLWQPLNITWLSLNCKTPQKRAIAYAVYVGGSNLGGTYGNQVFRASDAPLYRTAWTACISLGAVWLATLVLQVWALKRINRKSALEKQSRPELVAEDVYVTARGKSYRYYW